MSIGICIMNGAWTSLNKYSTGSGSDRVFAGERKPGRYRSPYRMLFKGS